VNAHESSQPFSLWLPVLATTSAVLWTWFGWWLRVKWMAKHTAKEELRSKEKEVFEQMLANHSRQFAHFNVNQTRTEHEFEENLVVTRNLLAWSSDEVLAEYAMYLERLSQSLPSQVQELKDWEVHFGKSILAFRKQLGYKNKRITPEQVATVFKAGWRGGHI
jgi:hypothetical protein